MNIVHILIRKIKKSILATTLLILFAGIVYAGQPVDWFYNPQTGKTDYFNDLDNLRGNLLPSADNTYDIGSATYGWQDIYLDGTLYFGTETITFDSTLTDFVFSDDVVFKDIHPGMYIWCTENDIAFGWHYHMGATYPIAFWRLDDGSVSPNVPLMWFNEDTYNAHFYGSLSIGNRKYTFPNSSPTDNYILKWNAATSTLGWEPDVTGATAWDDISNPDAADEIDFADYVIELKLGSSGDFRIGDGGSDYVKFGPDGAMSFVGNATVSLHADAIDAITEIKSTLKSGSDTTLITGTKGTNTYAAIWNADGDLVGAAGAPVITETDPVVAAFPKFSYIG